MTKKVKKGPSIDKVLFSAPGYNCLGDVWKSNLNITQRKQNNEAIAAAGHEKIFNPSKIVKVNYKAPFEHMTDRRNIEKNFRDEEGNVMVAPRNIQTNPIKKGRVGRNTSFSKTGYIEDEFDRPKELRLKERQHHASMLQDKPFS